MAIQEKEDHLDFLIMLSNTNSKVDSRANGEYLFAFGMTPSFHAVESPSNPGGSECIYTVLSEAGASHRTVLSTSGVLAVIQKNIDNPTMAAIQSILVR